MKSLVAAELSYVKFPTSIRKSTPRLVFSAAPIFSILTPPVFCWPSIREPGEGVFALLLILAICLLLRLKKNRDSGAHLYLASQRMRERLCRCTPAREPPAPLHSRLVACHPKAPGQSCAGWMRLRAFRPWPWTKVHCTLGTLPDKSTMSIYHLHVRKSVSRSRGQSVIATCRLLLSRVDP